MIANRVLQMNNLILIGFTELTLILGSVPGMQMPVLRAMFSRLRSLRTIHRS